jgi:radical SAM protein with 4Fe4S-binding SPASM domain
MTVRFTGGEPLLREDFQELYMFTRRVGKRVILFTNGRLVASELAALFARYPPGKPVEISLYGMHPESYDAAAGKKGAYESFWRGIGLLREHKVWFVVKSSILPPNRADMGEFEHWLTEMNPEDCQPRYAINFDLRAKLEDDPEKNERIKELRLSPGDTMSVLKRSPRYVENMSEFCGKFVRPPGDKLFSCGAGHWTCIDAYGKAQMCMGLCAPETVVDLREIPLKSALEVLFPKLRQTRASNPEYLARCAQCFLKGLCEQGPAKSWMKHGTLDGPVEYLCDVAHSQALYLGLITENEKAREVQNWRERIDLFRRKGDT